MAITNHERVGKALELLRAGLTPFVEREFKAKFGDGWAFEIRGSFADRHLPGRRQGRSRPAMSAVLLVVRWTASGTIVSSDPRQDRAEPG